MTDDPTLTPDLTAYDERSLLGCALHDPGTARELLRLVKHPDWFADARLARAWSALRRALAGVGDDPVMLPDAVARELAGDGGDAPTLDELIAIAKDVGRMVENAAYYAGRVDPALRAHGRTWATSVGGVLVLAGEGGIAKTQRQLWTRRRLRRCAGRVG